eukprot:TRINITY_DN3658_c0_g1_i2.p1 TRINITY_DN3658_c0_g1~~TRINITY_DN3658_c0_g1_i2.p1  ORF type:complete len:163 (-),score=51.16 TRINITY_DN3658_c0_g1_i2:76-564(-)
MTFYAEDIFEEVTEHRATADDIKKIEDLYGFEIPEDMKNFAMEIQDGGNLKNGGWVADCEIHGIASFGDTHDETIEDLKDMVEEWKIPEGFMPFYGDGHTWFAVDFRNKKKPTIVTLDQEKMRDGWAYCPAFDTFTDLLNQILNFTDENDGADDTYPNYKLC